MKPEDLKGVVHSNPEIMGGTPVFVGTRVPLQNLIDYLEGGESVEEFLEAFPTVTREQAIAVIEAGKLKMLSLGPHKMRILLDECLEWRLCRALPDHDCVSVRAMGWTGLTNGELRKKAAEDFDVFLTADSNLSFQQNLTRFDLAMIVLEPRTTRLADTLPMMQQVAVTLKTIHPRDVVRLRQL